MLNCGDRSLSGDRSLNLNDGYPAIHLGTSPFFLGLADFRSASNLLEKNRNATWPFTHFLGGIACVRRGAPSVGTIVDIRISQTARTDQMHRFELATCARLAPGASGVVRSDILVARNTPQHLARSWEVTEADIQWADSIYPVAQHAMQRGYYMPNRNSRHCSRHHCPYWRRCEQDFGGVVEA